MARETACSSPVVWQLVAVPLHSRLDKSAARALENDGRGTVDGDQLTLEIDRTPRLLQRAITQRAMHRPHFVDGYS
jgi:hypothetical protein